MGYSLPNSNGHNRKPIEVKITLTGKELTDHVLQVFEEQKKQLDAQIQKTDLSGDWIMDAIKDAMAQAQMESETKASYIEMQAKFSKFNPNLQKVIKDFQKKEPPNVPETFVSGKKLTKEEFNEFMKAFHKKGKDIIPAKCPKCALLFIVPIQLFAIDQSSSIKMFCPNPSCKSIVLVLRDGMCICKDE